MQKDNDIMTPTVVVVSGPLLLLSKKGCSRFDEAKAKLKQYCAPGTHYSPGLIEQVYRIAQEMER
jgi:hypothetical protein